MAYPSYYSMFRKCPQLALDDAEGKITARSVFDLAYSHIPPIVIETNSMLESKSELVYWYAKLKGYEIWDMDGSRTGTQC